MPDSFLAGFAAGVHPSRVQNKGWHKPAFVSSRENPSHDFDRRPAKQATTPNMANVTVAGSGTAAGAKVGEFAVLALITPAMLFW